MRSVENTGNNVGAEVTETRSPDTRRRSSADTVSDPCEAVVGRKALIGVVAGR